MKDTSLTPQPGSPANGTTAGPANEGPGKMKNKTVVAGLNLDQDGKLNPTPVREFMGFNSTPGPSAIQGDQPTNVKGGPQ